MNRVIKRIKIKTISLILLEFITICAIVMSAFEVKAKMTDTNVSSLNVDYHSKAEIAAYMRTHPILDRYDYNFYDEEPNRSAPYSPGVMTEKALNNAIEVLNTYRYIAGIPYDVTLNDEYNKQCQAAALVNWVNGKLSHTPNRPAGMSDKLYELGYLGASRSNLAMGGGTLPGSIDMWVDDTFSSTIEDLGHRRWALNPSMKETGFGMVYSTAAMYAFDSSNEAGEKYTQVAWPAQNTPHDMFDNRTAWSISMGKQVSKSSVEVKLTCINTDKTYTFSEKYADGDFYVSDGYGINGCIIFRVKNGVDTNKNFCYDVSITGKYKDGTPFNVSYSVDFFDPNEYLSVDEETEISFDFAEKVDVSYTTHIQSYGWQRWVTDGAMSGTSGEAKRLEGIKIKLDTDEDLEVQYRTHVQSYGWQEYVQEGKMSGTSGEAKRLEAISIKLSGSDADKYDIFYRVHAQSYGWLGWAKNGENAGTAGQGKRLEGIQIIVMEKGKVPNTGTVGYSYVELGKTAQNDLDSGMVNYMTHVQSYGDQSYVYDGSVSGTFGEAKRLEGIRINLNTEKLGVPGGITYKTHVQTYGWLDWSSDGVFNGTSGEAKRLEAIQIQLTGEVETQYDVYYRVHSQTYGWLGWAKNGEISGTYGLGKRLEGIQIVLLPKGMSAPGHLPGESGVDKYITK